MFPTNGSWAVAALLACPLCAAENTYLPDQPGKVAVTVSKGALPQHGLKPEEAARYLQSLTRLQDLILARPLLRNPVGFTLKGYFRVNDHPGPPRLPAPGFAYLRFHPMVKDWHTGQPVAFLVSTWEILVGINQPCAALQPVGDLDAPLYAAPAPAGTVDGRTVYTVGSGNELLVFTRSGRLPWIPVSRGEYADLVLEHWRKLASDPLAASALQPFLVRYEAWRSAMAPEEKNLQAWSGMENASLGLAPGPLLVKQDPAWYDPALPRSAFQILTLTFDYSGDLDFRHPEASVNPAPLRVWQVLHQSPWADLADALTAR